MMHVCCTLGPLLHQQEPAAEASSSSSSSRPVAAAGLGREWVALVAKCLLHISGWLQQQPAAHLLEVADKTAVPAEIQIYWAAVHENAQPAAQALMYSWGGVQLTKLLQRVTEDTPLQLLLRCCSFAVSWLTEQLPAVGLPGGDVQPSACDRQRSSCCSRQQMPAVHCRGWQSDCSN
jgi:hypothetical protein